MRTLVILSLFAFYMLGDLLLPLGDFSILPGLPGMYANCRQTEDNDLTVFEFVTEHLTGLAHICSGSEHAFCDEPGDRPHTPVQFHFQLQLVVCSIAVVKIPAIKSYKGEKVLASATEPCYVNKYISKIFRPPAA